MPCLAAPVAAPPGRAVAPTPGPDAPTVVPPTALGPVNVCADETEPGWPGTGEATAPPPPGWLTSRPLPPPVAAVGTPLTVVPQPAARSAVNAASICLRIVTPLLRPRA